VCGGAGRIFSIADLAAKVEEDLNCAFEDYIPLPDNHMVYVKTELRKRCRRARGIAWSDDIPDTEVARDS
jgi:hypothetical protein